MQVGSVAAAALHRGVKRSGIDAGIEVSIEVSSGGAVSKHRGVGLHSHPVGEDNAGGTGEAVPLPIVVSVCVCVCVA